MIEEAHIAVMRTARYYTLGGDARSPRELWFACHGYGQLARYFARHFEPLDDGTRTIVVPEGLSRFYFGDPRARHGAHRSAGPVGRQDPDRHLPASGGELAARRAPDPRRRHQRRVCHAARRRRTGSPPARREARLQRVPLRWRPWPERRRAAGAGERRLNADDSVPALLDQIAQRSPILLRRPTFLLIDEHRRRHTVLLTQLLARGDALRSLLVERVRGGRRAALFAKSAYDDDVLEWPEPDTQLISHPHILRRFHARAIQLDLAAFDGFGRLRSCLE